MKSLLVFASVMMAASASLAMAKCPQGTTTVKVCRSTPKAGDNVLASGLFQSIAICSQGTKTLLAVEANDKTEAGEAKVSMRAGGTSYSVMADDTEFTISVTTGIRPGPTTPATLTVTMQEAGLTVSSTYTCK